MIWSEQSYGPDNYDAYLSNSSMTQDAKNWYAFGERVRKEEFLFCLEGNHLVAFFPFICNSTERVTENTILILAHTVGASQALRFFLVNHRQYRYFRALDMTPMSSHLFVSRLCQSIAESSH